jgi:ABC-type molybdate transport system substrate-binding protein
MKKEMNRGVVIGILVLVGVVVVMMGWKAIAPPAPNGIKQFSPAEMKEVQAKHAASVTDMQEQQKKLYQQAHGGGQ